MSTEGSDSITSSQIRRFGLYRTIDAKTEEFLRLSRKRQIRQGCACAAISTTITVTVVVTVILIYEYSMISKSNSRTTLTPKWLNLMNTSVDNLPFEVKLDKARIGLDPATIKFLPLILKTLKNHKYFDKMPEETSSQNPEEDKIESTDHNIYDKNVFSDTRNWMRVPTSRLYTIEYKTSPIVYFKSPTRNIDYFTKVRKIRDYQRIMNYVDKMISERVTFGSTIPMNKNIYKHKNLLDYTTPMAKTVDHGTQTQNEPTKKPKITTSKHKPNCSCPKRMNALLTKLINSLQKLLPNFTDMPDKSSYVTKPCMHGETKLIPGVTQAIIYKPEPESSTNSFNSITKRKLVVKVSSRPYRTQATTTSLPKLDYTLNAIIALLKPDVLKKDMKKKNVISKSTTTRNYVEGTDRVDNLENATETMKNISAAKLSISATTIRDYILSSDSEITTQTIFNYPKYYENNTKTTPSFVNNYKTHLEHKVGLVGRKINSNIKGQKSNEIEGKNKFSYDNSNKESTNLPSKITELDVSSSIGTSLDLAWELREKTKSFDIEESVTRNSAVSNINLNRESVTNQDATDINKIEQTQKPEDITLEEEIEKTSPEDVIAEENLKNLENIIKTLNNSGIYNKTTTQGSEFYEWELIKIEDDDNNDIFTKSMIPEDKASYLEIQRNDWKPDEHQDYDNNINHYLFE